MLICRAEGRREGPEGSSQRADWSGGRLARAHTCRASCPVCACAPATQLRCTQVRFWALMYEGASTLQEGQRDVGRDVREGPPPPFHTGPCTATTHCPTAPSTTAQLMRPSACLLSRGRQEGVALALEARRQSAVAHHKLGVRPRQRLPLAALAPARGGQQARQVEGGGPPVGREGMDGWEGEARCCSAWAGGEPQDSTAQLPRSSSAPPAHLSIICPSARGQASTRLCRSPRSWA